LIADIWFKGMFVKAWRNVVPAILLPAAGFIIWDEVFTQLGIWGFNSKYISGWNIGSLPIEEILFFICIPFACLFTYHAYKNISDGKYFFSQHELLSYLIVMALLIAGIYNIDRAYTSITFLASSFFLAYLTLKVRVRFPGFFYGAFLIILAPFFIVNGILTGSFIEEEVVWYEESATLGLRLGTIPFEDIVYAMLLILMNVTVYEWRLRAQQNKTLDVEEPRKFSIKGDITNPIGVKR
jgi:lycopene cyclase domain-containing protein